MADEPAHKQREVQFREAARDAFAFLEATYGMSVAKQGWGHVWFASDRVGMMIATHRGEIDVGFRLNPEMGVDDYPTVECFLCDVLRLTGPDVKAACPCFEESDLPAQLQRVADQVAEYCRPVLRGDAEAYRQIQELRREASVGYTHQFIRRQS